VASNTGFIAGAFIGINDPISGSFWFGHQVGAVAGNVVTVDRPLNATYPIGAVAHTGSHNMNVNGSVTPQIFSVRPVGDDIDIDLDVTRIIVTIFTDTQPDFGEFGDIASLTRGVCLRHTNGINNNLFCIKNNGELSGLSYDMQFITALGQGQAGVSCRMTFSKMGAVVRIGPGEDLELIVQDNLVALDKFNIIAEGSVVTRN
jgi:hypothetical protein